MKPLPAICARPATSRRRRDGFTITEVMASTLLLTGVVGIALGLATSTLMHARDGSVHLSVIGKARCAMQDITRKVQAGRGVGVVSNTLSIVMADLTVTEIRYVDADDDPDTIADNRLEYDPDPATTGDESVLCDFVTPIPGEPIFQILSTSPRSAVVAFHVGERPPPGAPALLPGDGHQGIEIRLTSSPRTGMGVY